jgi:DHA2 family multidrug resistance protein
MAYVNMFTAAYMYVPTERRSDATCLFSLIRSEASGIGIALATTMMARRSQFHRFRPVEYLDRADPATAERLQQMAQVAKDAGFDAVTAGEKGLGLLGRLAEGQAMSLAYFDMYWMFGLGCLTVLPAVFLMRRSVADRTNSVKD